MATTVGSVLIAVDVDLGRMSRFSHAANTVARESGRMRQSVVVANNNMANAFTRTAAAVSVLHGPLGGVASRISSIGTLARTSSAAMAGLALSAGGAGFALTKIVQSADKMRRIENNLRTVTSGTSELAEVQQNLVDVANRSRASTEATVTFYARVARATEHLGMSQQKLLRITETVQKAFAIGGASTAEAQGAAIQLSQGIASDRFSGDEFRSVAENAPVLLREMGKSIGVTIGQLREMAHEGKLTTEVVTKAILDASEAIDRDFGKTIPTVQQSFVRLRNEFDQWSYQMDKTYGLTDMLSAGILTLAENFDTLGKYALFAAAAVATAVAGRVGAAAVGRRGEDGIYSGIQGQFRHGLFHGARRRAAEEKAAAEKLIANTKKDLEDVEKQMARARQEGAERTVAPRLAQTQALESARKRETAALQQQNDLVARRSALMSDLSKAHQGILAQLKAELAESRQVVATRSSQLAAAQKRFGKTNAVDDLKAVEAAQANLDKARANSQVALDRIAAAEKDVFSAVAPKKYATEVSGINKQLAALQKTQKNLTYEVVNGQNAQTVLNKAMQDRAALTGRLQSAQIAAHKSYIGQLKVEQAELLKSIDRQVQVGTAGLDARARRGAEANLAALQKRYAETTNKISQLQKIAFSPDVPKAYLGEVASINKELAANQKTIDSITKTVNKGGEAQAKINAALKEQGKLANNLERVYARAFNSGQLGEYGNAVKQIGQQIAQNHKDQVAAGRALVKAQQDYVAAQRMSPEVVAKTRLAMEQAERNLQGLVTRQADLNNELKTAESTVARTTRQMSLMGGVMMRAGGLLRGMWGLIGGGPGAAIMAIVGSFVAIQSSIAKSQQETEEWNAKLKEAGYLADKAADSASSIDAAIESKNASRLREELRQLEEQADKARRGGFWTRFGISSSERGMDQVINDIDAMVDGLSRAAYEIERVGNTVPEGMSSRMDDLQRFSDIAKAARETGQISAEAANEIQNIANKHTDLDKLKIEFENLTTVVSAYELAMRDLRTELDMLGQGDEKDRWNILEQMRNLQTLRGMQSRDAFNDFMKEAEATARLTKEEQNHIKVKQELKAAYDELIKKNPELRNLIEPLAEAWDQAAESVIRNTEAAGLLSDAQERAKKKAQELTEGLVQAALDGKISIQDMTKAMENMAKLNPDLSHWIDQITGAARAAWEFVRAGKAASGVWTMQESQGGRTRHLPGITQTPENAPVPGARPSDAERFDWSGTKKSMSDAAKAAQKLKEGLEGLALDARASQLDEFNQKVVQQARSFGIATSEIEKYIDAMATGNWENIPKVFEQIAAELDRSADNELFRKIEDLKLESLTMSLSDVDRELVNLAQSAGFSLPRIMEIIAALRTGDVGQLEEGVRRLREQLEITAKDKKIEELADGMANAFGDFFRSVIKGSESFGDALANLGLRIADLILELLVIQPLIEALKNSFSSGFGGGGGIGGIVSSVLGFFFHGGGTVGSGGKYGPLPLGAPYVGKAHRGRTIGSNDNHKEVLAALEVGETVLTKAHTQSVIGTMNALSNVASSANLAREIVLHVVGEEGPMFRPTIRAESEGVSLRVSQAGFDQYGKAQRRGGLAADQTSFQMLKRR